MDDSRLKMLQEVSSCAEAFFQARKDAEYAFTRQMEIRQEISNARNLINNLGVIAKTAEENYELKRKIANKLYSRAEENYELKRKIANKLYSRLEAAKTALDLAEQSA
jgi:hypothetical protein